MLLKDDCEVVLTENVDRGLAALASQPPDLIVLDLVMPQRGGLDFLSELSSHPDAPPVIVLTGTQTIATAVEAMKQGAADYITKPFEVEALRIKIRQLLAHRRMTRELAELRSRIEPEERLVGLIGTSEPMQEVFRTIRRVAESRATVLIHGESGTGKELAARAIHELGERRDAAFVAVNCAGIPDTLIESELFGHERGAFTDAKERRIGRFESASGGTLFLDEVGELSPGAQARLLRALQEKQIDRVGGTQPIDIDARVLAATNRDLDHEVAEGRFRADLYYRIHVVPIEMPPLRARGGDVGLLARHFLAKAREETGRGPERLSRDAVAVLDRYPWPGNVRELQNAIDHAVALCDGDVVELDDLPRNLVETGRVERLRDAVREGELGFDQAVADFERTLLAEALERAEWNQTRASEQLGITRRTLKLKMDRYGLTPPDPA
jgi:DNA-binding NtrC family response regulator